MCEIETKGDSWKVVAFQEEIDGAMKTIASGIRNQLRRKYEKELKSGRISAEAIEEKVKEVIEELEEEIFHSIRKEERKDGKYILDVRNSLLVENLIPARKVPA